MRQKMLILALLPLFLVLQPLAQGTIKDFVGSAQTFDGVGDSIVATGNGYGTVGFQVTGTWDGTISFSGSINGTTWVSVRAWSSESAASDSETTVNGIYFASTAGLRYVKARMSARNSGSATVQNVVTDDAGLIASLGAAGGGGGAEGTVDLTGINGNTPATGNGTASSGTLRVAIASNNTAFSVNAAVTSIAAGSNNIGDVDVASIAAGDNNIGNVDVVTLPALAAGTNNIGDVDVLSLNDGGNSVTVDNGGTFAVQAGQAAHDAAIAGNPVRTGLRAATAHPTAVATGDQVDQLGTIEGKAVTQPYAVRGETWSYAAASGGITDVTAVTVKTAAGAGVRNCITSIQVINGHASVSTETLVLDGAAGTVIWRGFAQAGGGGAAAEFPVPLCGSANTLLEVDNGTTGAAVYYNLQGFESQE